MTEESGPKHVDPEEMIDFMEGTLPESRQGELAEHFADCDLCTAQARRYQAQSDLLESWTARSHGEAYWSAAMTHALERVAAERPNLRDRLTLWKDRSTGKAAATLKVIMERAGSAARIITEGVESLLLPATPWKFQLEPTVVQVPGAIRTRGGEPPVVAIAPGESPARVAVSSESKTVEVRVEKWPSEKPPPLVLLIPVSEGPEAQIVELEKREGGGIFLGRFESVEPGEYVVAFEPMEDAITQ